MTSIAIRLKLAREHAGFESASDAAAAFRWTYTTYAGHENGSRGIKPDNIRKYAGAFRVSLDWLMTGRGPMIAGGGRAPDTPASTGFSEPDLSEFIAATDAAKTTMRRVTELLCPGIRNPITYKLNRDYPGLMLARGDILLVDQHTQSKSGQIALVQVADVETGAGATRLKMKRGTHLVAPFAAPYEDSETEQEVEYGTVLATIRSEMIN